MINITLHLIYKHIIVLFISMEKIKSFLSKNKSDIIHEWHSTNMCWCTTISGIPKCIYYRDTTDDKCEILFFLENTHDDFMSGFPFAIKKNNEWELKIMSDDKSSHICDICKKFITKGDYKCLDCSDYDICNNCYQMRNTHNPIHQFSKFYIGSLGWNTYDRDGCLSEFDIEHL